MSSGRSRPNPHELWFNASYTPGDQPTQNGKVVTLRPALRCDHHGGRTVSYSRRISGGDRASLLEVRTQFREGLRSGFRTHVFISVENLGTLGRFHLDRHDLAGEVAALPCFMSKPL